MPELDKAMETAQNHPHHCYSVGEHTIHSLSAIDCDEEYVKYLRFAMLFHDLGKPKTHTVDDEEIDHFHGHAFVSADMAKEILQRLKFDNETIRVVTKLVEYHDYKVEEGTKYVRRAINRMGEDIFPLVLKVKKADVLAQSVYKREEKLEHLKVIEVLYQEVLANKQCVSLKTLAVTGKDLIALGMTPGKELGEVLQKLLELVIEDPSMNTKEKLLEVLQNM